MRGFCSTLGGLPSTPRHHGAQFGKHCLSLFRRYKILTLWICGCGESRKHLVSADCIHIFYETGIGDSFFGEIRCGRMFYRGGTSHTFLIVNLVLPKCSLYNGGSRDCRNSLGGHVGPI